MNRPQLTPANDAMLDLHSHLDMDYVARRALGMRAWHLEYDCHGAPITWRGEALNEAAADATARRELAVKIATFNPAEATLTVCLEA